MKTLNPFGFVLLPLVLSVIAPQRLFGQVAVIKIPIALDAAVTSKPTFSSPPLPDAPSFSELNDDQRSVEQRVPRFAPKYANTIEPEYQSQSQGAKDKVVFAVTELGSWHYDFGSVIAAGFSHATNSNPKYGTNSDAFAQRVGAAAARAGGQIIISKAILAPILHEDTRYYVLGSEHRVLPRVFYAASRVVLTRTDKGRQTLNVAELAGYGGSAAMTQFYYPQGARNMEVMLEGYAASLGGSALENEIAEFLRYFVRHQPR